MPKKITYLLGAGASADALPTIAAGSDKKKGLSQKLYQFVTEHNENFKESNIIKTNIPLTELANSCIAFKTPDLYAKYLLEIGDYNNYKRLKILMSHFFNNEQQPYDIEAKVGGFGVFDFRALQFLITITENKKIPKHIKLISWNYDQQIEIAAQRMKLNSSSNFAAWPNIPNANYNDEFSLLHLNGVAGFNYDMTTLCHAIEEKFTFDLGPEPLLSFAWEDAGSGTMNTFFKQRLSHLEEMAKGTEILVVIGYSFPFFNRGIDKKLIDVMRDSLTTIYYQDPNEQRDGSFLYDQFNLPRKDDNFTIGGGKPKRKINIHHIKDVGQYYIPYEL